MCQVVPFRSRHQFVAHEPVRRLARRAAIAIALTSISFTACTKIEEDPNSHGGTFYPSQCVTLRARKDDLIKTFTTVTVCQPIRFSELATMTEGYDSRIPGNTLTVARLEFSNGAYYVSTDRLALSGRVEYDDHPHAKRMTFVQGCVGFLVVVGVIGAAVWIMYLYNEHQKRIAAEEAARRRSEEAVRAAQERCRLEMLALNRGSIQAFETIPQIIETAERHLDRAERNFSEGAFAPFWDSIEKAAGALGAVHQVLQLIKRNSAKYVELAKKYQGKQESFAVSPASPAKLKVAAATSNRMNRVVRKAQRNFQFSMIYEQRKTNQILVAGFKNLAQALDEMTWRITSSVDELTASIGGMAATLNDSLREIQNHAAQVASAAETYMQDSSARSEREEKVLEMLDNIQRKRHPSLLHGGIR